MAARGKKVAVLTIDPAKRLANSLGLDELGNEERLVEADVDGELWAMMLDAKRTFDDLVEWHAPDERTRDAVLSNRIYQELSNAVAGSQEYMAMEKLYELHQEGRYDLLVLDTPPTRNALDFIDAPKRLADFIDSRSLQFFTTPGLFGLKVFGRGSGLVFSVLRRATGIDLLEDLSAFFSSFGSMTEGFRERAGARERAARRQPHRLRARDLTGRRRDRGGALVPPPPDRRRPAVRRRRRQPRPPQAAARRPGTADLGELLEPALARKVLRTWDEERQLAARDRENLATLKRRLGRKPIIEIPYIDDDVHDLEGLRRMDRFLFAVASSRMQTGAE